MKGVSIIEKKGYTFDEASKIALRCFEEAEANKNGLSVEWYLNKIVTKDEWKKMEGEMKK